MPHDFGELTHYSERRVQREITGIAYSADAYIYRYTKIQISKSAIGALGGFVATEKNG